MRIYKTKNYDEMSRKAATSNGETMQRKMFSM